jgi:hypothetical protein
MKYSTVILVLLVLVIIGIILYNTVFKSKIQSESFATISDFTNSGLLTIYNSNYASSCPPNAVGNNNIECFLYEVLAQFANTKYILQKGSNYFIKTEVNDLITTLIDIIKNLHDTNTLAPTFTYQYLVNYITTPSSVSDSLDVYLDGGDITNKTLYIPNFVDNILKFFFDKKCDPDSGDYTILVNEQQNTVNNFNTEIAEYMNYYKAVCKENQPSCDEFDFLVARCIKENGKNSPLCKNIKLPCVEPPYGLSKLTCPQVVTYINAQQAAVTKQRESLSNAQCDLCNFCQHPGDLSLCESVCNQQITRPPQLKLTNTNTATTTNTPSPTIIPVNPSTNNPTNVVASTNNTAANTVANTAASTVATVDTTIPNIPTMFPPYSFSLDSTAMNSTHLFDNSDSYAPIGSLNPALLSIGNILGEYNYGNYTSQTYDNTATTNTLIQEITTQIANQLQLQMNSGNISNYGNGMGSDMGSGGAGMGSGGAGVGTVYQDHIEGVSNVFAPNIIINPVVPQSAYESMVLM